MAEETRFLEGPISQDPEENPKRSGIKEYRKMFITVLSSLERVSKDIVSLRLGMGKICGESLE